ncbi:DUF1398 domain-containing protein [Flavobacterium beibuense]|uniref:Phage envelope protein-like protein n=1 Tax=Flavobacterium beibuense TaxID=657326 RepID=A0A444WIP6_9FLAO|nr:DUF1398 family protein [Flavobacterium beibuense]RYJ45616.1 Phage envelope protein-like protein [Flavobacterium beibuense]
MFTIDQIKEAHSKVKSGADFPQYIQDLIALGVIHYNTYVKDGHTVYWGCDNYRIQSPPKYDNLLVADTGNMSDFIHHLNAHQAGETDYPQFCKDAANDGVEKWVVDMVEMTCIYYDRAGHKIYEEEIPTP